MKKPARKITTLDRTALRSTTQHYSAPAAGRTFGAPRMPQSFHTVVDPDKHPKQPWRDLPPPPGLPPFRMSLDSILSPDSISSIINSGRWYFIPSATPEA